jgi:type VI secretion system secreted protein Hcp
MAETVHLYLKANGADIKGESSQESLGRKDSIECVHYEQEVKTAREQGTGMVTGRRQYQPLRIIKRIDKASPLLMKALTNNEKIDGVFKFFRPNPKGDGTTEQFFSVEIKEGHIASVKDYVPNTLEKEEVHHPPLEEVTFVFKTIKWTFTNGGVTHQDSWSGNA